MSQTRCGLPHLGTVARTETKPGDYCNACTYFGAELCANPQDDTGKFISVDVPVPRRLTLWEPGRRGRGQRSARPRRSLLPHLADPSKPSLLSGPNEY
jgi:hypothetical protein